MRLKDLKDSNSVDAAEFDVARCVDKQTVFAWWVSHAFKKRNVIISVVTSRACKITYENIIELPYAVEEACLIEKRNGNTFWRDSIEKQMLDVDIDFEIVEEGESTHKDLKQVTGHLIFDKMDFA